MLGMIMHCVMTSQSIMHEAWLSLLLQLAHCRWAASPSSVNLMMLCALVNNSTTVLVSAMGYSYSTFRLKLGISCSLCMCVCGGGGGRGALHVLMWKGTLCGLLHRTPSCMGVGAWHSNRHTRNKARNRREPHGIGQIHCTRHSAPMMWRFEWH